MIIVGSRQRCVCGHDIAFHEWFKPKGKPGYRRACSVRHSAGKCPCLRYVSGQSDRELVGALYVDDAGRYRATLTLEVGLIPPPTLTVGVVPGRTVQLIYRGEPDGA